ncbi:YSIRK-type signal peptide-containing protein, partial [Streptococcus sp. 339]|uniref:YSIRK-type signal peptide-containing protein n=1 Tax=Streptococcus sp. 339 TaxID=2582643 RepID=UPI001561F6B4
MFYKGNEDREKRLRFSIRKVSFGAASVAVAALYLFMGSGAVSAEEAQAIQSNEEVAADKDSEIEKKSEEQQPTYAAPAAKEQGSATNTEAGDEGKQESHPETKEEEASSSERSEPIRKTQSDENSVSGDSSSPKSTEGSEVSKSEGEATKSEEASRKPKVRKRRDTDSALTATATDDDSDANQTYQAPRDDAGLDELQKKLEQLPSEIQNNTKINDMDKLGDAEGVLPGKVKEIMEFGGWRGVTINGERGKFTIARKTVDGVFPLETINVTLNDTVWLTEQAFDRDSNYVLLLAKPRNRHNHSERVSDNSNYKYKGEGSGISKNIVGFNGIEKTFGVYNSAIDSTVTIKFKTGYTGDDEGHKAKYKVEVFSIENDMETNVYTAIFDPSKTVMNGNMNVIAASNGSGTSTIRISTTPNNATSESSARVGYIGKDEAEKKIAQAGNRPNGRAGMFISKPIMLEKGVNKYKVRISLAEQNRAGGSYQSWDEKYTLPISGKEFSISQSTNQLAKILLKEIYSKLEETKERDITNVKETSKNDYLNQLQTIKTLIDSNNLKTTTEYKQELQRVIEKKAALELERTTAALSAASNTEADATKASAAYYNEQDPDKKRAYDAAVQAGKDVLAKANPTQAAIDQAKAAIDQAKAALTGSETNTAALSAASNTEADATKASAAYYNEQDPDKKRAYDAAVQAGKDVLAKANPTQAEVDQAKAAIDQA